jgi:hypothetical protein
MHMRPALVFAALALACTAFAHPPVTVVIDSRGNVYYSDLSQVWRVAADGTKTVVVSNVHTHELSLDARDNVFGEHLWYEGDHTKKWGHYVWKRDGAGRVTRIKPASSGFLSDYGFARDRAGALYWPQRDKGEIRKRTADGKVTRVAGELKGMAWLHATPSGTLYVVDGGDLVRVVNGRATRIARQIARKPFGIWTDAAENIYVADYATREVKRVTPSGAVSTYVTSTLPWAPVGGAFARNGDLWLLEASMTNEVRVRKIAAGSLR